jgi:hypothetical protein
VSVLRNATGLLAAISFIISSSAWAIDVPTVYDLPNDTIAPSGSPAFYNEVSINMNDNSGRLSITGRGEFLLEDNATLYDGEKLYYKMLVFYDNAGNFSSGTVTVKGTIPSLGITKTTELAMADIDEWNLHDDPNLWAFGTTNLICSPLLPFGCTTSESVYVPFLGDGFDGDFDNGKFTAAGYAVTTLPVPAAAWLFGSALGLLGWMRRRSTRVLNA